MSDNKTECEHCGSMNCTQETVNLYSEISIRIIDLVDNMNVCDIQISDILRRNILFLSLAAHAHEQRLKNLPPIANPENSMVALLPIELYDEVNLLIKQFWKNNGNTHE